MTATPADAAPDYNAITSRQQVVWASGDFSRLGARAIMHGEQLCEAVDLRAGERVLDVAAGNGAVAVAAARRWADVTATDFVDHLLDSALTIAGAYGLELDIKVCDAQDLPFGDDTFDVVLSAFGAMFAPDQQRVADELIRVCRPGGRIGMANWKPDSLVGDVQRTVAAHVTPPAGLRPAGEWGTERRLAELFGNRVGVLRLKTRRHVFRYPSPQHLLDDFRTWYGPTRIAFGSLDKHGQARLGTDLLEVCRSHNRAEDGTLVAPAEYAEVIAAVR